VKALGDHTNALVAMTTEPGSRMWMRVDGPYGNHNLNYRRYPHLLLVAGGVGITPVVGLLRDIYRVGDLTATERGRIAPHFMERVVICWVMPTIDVYGMFSEEMEECLAIAGTNGLPKLELYVYATREQFGNGNNLVKSQRPNAHFLPGRPDIPVLYETMMGYTLSGQEGQTVSDSEAAKKAATVFVCGPEQLVNDTWDSANAWLQGGHRFDFHHETFDF